MHYLREIKRFNALLKNAHKKKISGFFFKYNWNIVPFLKFLIKKGTIYTYVVFPNSIIIVYLKPLLLSKNIKHKKFKIKNYRFLNIKKKVFRIQSTPLCFSTNLGLIDKQEIMLNKLGGLYLSNI